MGLLKFFNNLKEDATNWNDERKNIKLLQDNGHNVLDLRVCNAPKDNVFFYGCVNKEERKILFASKKPVEIDCVLVDKFQHLYKVVDSNYETNELFEEETTTTVSKYVPFIPNNPVRNSLSQNAEIVQQLNGNHFENIQNLVLNIEQKAKIEQSISVTEMYETVEDELKYRYEPVKGKVEFLALLAEIIKGTASIEGFQSKIVESVLKQSSSFLKDIIELLIKTIKKSVDEKGLYKPKQ